MSRSPLGAAFRAASGTLNLHAAASFVDDRLSDILSSGSSHAPPPPPPPHLVALFTLCSSALLFAAVARLRKLLYRVESRGGAAQCSLDFVKSLPLVRGLLKKEMTAMEKRLRGSLPARPPSLPQRRTLPAKGAPAEEVLAALVEAARRDGDGKGKLSGALYLPKEEEGGNGGGGEEEFVVVFDDEKDESDDSKKKKPAKENGVVAKNSTSTSSTSSPPAPSRPRPARAAGEAAHFTHSTLLNAAYAAFAHTNPMHSSVFPSAVCLERDVVAMTSSILSGSTPPPSSDADAAADSASESSRVRGQVTSGGSESILLAVLAAREYSFRTGKCVRFGDEARRPEIVLAASAHAAFFKAAHYFGMRVKVMKPSSSSSSSSGAASAAGARLTANDVRRHLTRNTVLVVASAPSFPHGIVDDVEGIAREISKRGIPLHVDCCLGGFVLAFAKEASEEAEAKKGSRSDRSDDNGNGDHAAASAAAASNNRRRQSLRFDFSVPGVTSISIDVHKFGLSHKGTSVLLFKGSEKVDGATLRRSAFVATSDWPGGLYVSPGVAGSRSGALLAAAWASLVFVGREGYVSAARSIFAEVDAFISGIEGAASDPSDPLSELEVIRGDDDDDEGFPLGPVVAFRAREKIDGAKSKSPPFNIYVLNDVLSEKGWHLNALQRPAALHCCFTAQHARGGAKRLLEDLGWAVGTVRERQRAREKEESESAAAAAGAGSASKKAQKKDREEGMAPVYGMASASPDRGLVGEFLLTFQDVLLTG